MKETLSSYIRMAIKMYPHKHGEELASEIIELLRRKRFDIFAEEKEIAKYGYVLTNDSVGLKK